MKNLFHTLLGFTRTEYTKRTYTGEKPINISGIDKIHLKCDFFDGSFVNGFRQPFLYSFALDKCWSKET